MNAEDQIPVVLVELSDYLLEKASGSGACVKPFRELFTEFIEVNTYILFYTCKLCLGVYKNPVYLSVLLCVRLSTYLVSTSLPNLIQ